MDLTLAILTDHARDRMRRRGITEDQVRQVLADPEAVLTDRPGRVVAQGMIDPEHLLRVFVDIDRLPPEVVTLYQTSQLRKFRSPS
jgi:hypothetical protein